MRVRIEAAPDHPADGDAIADRPGLASALSGAIRDLKESRHTSETLASAAGAVAAQQAALNAPGRLPAKVGEKYRPPGQSAVR